jgi:arylsulfatase
LTAAPSPPNVVLLFADDLGFADLGCYGGETRTPNLDALAAGGLRLTQGYNTARCWPSRASIMSGYYPQQVRRDTVPGVNKSNNGTRPAWATLLPAILKSANYKSYHSGKWHIDSDPLKEGFEHSYVLNDHDRNFNPKNHVEDGKSLEQPKPDGSYYTTTAIAEHAVKCLKNHPAGMPFFSYVAFTCPHFPLQAPAADVAKYRDTFKAGWDVHRAARHQRLKEMGIVDCALSARTDNVTPWASLTAAEQTAEATRMAVHAAMIDRMDIEIGRIVAQVKAMNAFENTLFIFVSDNGASHERLVRGDGHAAGAEPGAFNSFQCLEPGWANVANSPLRLSKMFVHEGGISTPWIMHWPQAIAEKNALRRTPAHLIDIPVTIAALAGAKWPAAPVPVPGRDLSALLKGDTLPARDFLWWHHNGNKALRIGDWKIVAKGEKSAWELYNLALDRCEQVDLAAKEPDRVKAMQAKWDVAWAQYQKDAVTK